MRERAADILPLLLAVVVPLAGLVLAVHAAAQRDRPLALRLGLATLLGLCLWALVIGATG